MDKRAKTIIAVLVAALAVLLVLAGINGAKTAGRKNSINAVISCIISEKKAIAQLTTCKIRKDVQLIDYKNSGKEGARRKGKKVAVYIGYAELNVGVNLESLKKTDFRESGDTIYINLPPPEVLEVHINTDKITEVYSRKDWDYDERMPHMIAQAKEDLCKESSENGLLLEAGEKAEKALSRYLGKICRRPIVAKCRPLLLSMPSSEERSARVMHSGSSNSQRRSARYQNI